MLPETWGIVLCSQIVPGDKNMLIIGDNQFYYRMAEVGPYQQKYPLRMVKKGLSPTPNIEAGRLETIDHSSDGGY
jgi:hypothetical protein